MTFFHNMNKFILKVFLCLLLFVYFVSTEMQGLFSTDCNFQGLSRPNCVRTPYKAFKNTLQYKARSKEKTSNSFQITEKLPFSPGGDSGSRPQRILTTVHSLRDITATLRGTLGGTQYRNTVRKNGKYRNTASKIV